MKIALTQSEIRTIIAEHIDNEVLDAHYRLHCPENRIDLTQLATGDLAVELAEKGCEE